MSTLRLPDANERLLPYPRTEWIKAPYAKRRAHVELLLDLLHAITFFLFGGFRPLAFLFQLLHVSDVFEGGFVEVPDGVVRQADDGEGEAFGHLESVLA